MINVDIYFPMKVNEQQALAIAMSILPVDAAPVATFNGVNPDYSTKSSGSCRQSTYTSAALGGAVRQANPTWTADPAKANIILYSGHATSEDGADKPYSPTSVNLASVGIGPENRGTDGIVHC
ncbi:hypothetical protein LWP59_05515 [Amycolatopsis acidiphila]|uniref:Uncharacterized protein n=1 Tax=Amycolatopsis acidiphila TaxID=715473 RepID=A0A558AI25_9PSEU|nr:hypothetical protein [Amycolatopsis acidiphila]TVT23915.1 hypothetical protein FNH06_08650 [Amycolatopsis acidiphila]UIJ61108.1 hypothetical protein LWP59_05515 [Amycolatopsis acidiphila]GHG86723.1 hypothetical protein GCM10017788_60070 [Amycolatopsis acidiphila]